MNPIIVLDPGHGGTQTGAVANGMREKDLNLDIAQRTRFALQAFYGYKAVMTREDDRTLSLTERYRMANGRNASLFVSIHCNAFDGKTRGYETFVRRNPDARRLLVGKTLHARMARFYAKDFCKAPDRGLKTQDFTVLRYTAMPAVLVENLFMDHKVDASLLKKESFRIEIAKALAVGIREAIGVL